MKLRIEPKKGRRGNIFEVHLLTSIVANLAWDYGRSKNIRPVYLAFTGTHDHVRAFSANIRKGRIAGVINEHGHERGRLEVMRSAGYKWVTHRDGDATVVQVFLPHVVELDPGFLEENISFVFMPPAPWVNSQLHMFNNYPEEERRERVVAGFFSAFLDRRTALPMPPDSDFHLALYRAAQKQKWFYQGTDESSYYTRSKVSVRGLAGLENGFAQVALVHASREDLDGFITHQLTEEGSNGQNREPGKSRLLSNSTGAGTGNRRSRHLATQQRLRPQRLHIGSGRR